MLRVAGLGLNSSMGLDGSHSLKPASYLLLKGTIKDVKQTHIYTYIHIHIHKHTQTHRNIGGKTSKIW